MERLFTASYNGLPEPDIDIAPDRPEYHVLTDTEKETLAAVTYSDNCSVTLYWSLLDDTGSAVSSEAGVTLANRSDAITDHEIILAGAETANKEYTLIYWVKDSCGNVGDDYSILISVTPRPQIIRMNDAGFAG